MAVATTRRPAFLDGGGELGNLIAAFPWQTTVLGPIMQWPAHIGHTVALMLRSAVPMVALFDEPGVMIYNDAYSVLAGDRHPRLLGSPVREGWPEVADFNHNVMDVGLAGGTLSYKDQELTLYRHGAAEQVWMNLDYSPVLDDGGRPAAVLAIVVETTAKVRAERRLADERARLSQMFEQAPGFICTLRGPQQVFESANAAYRKLFPRELIGRSVREAFPDIEGQGYWERLDEVFRTGRPYRAEAMPARLRKADGQEELRYLSFVYQPLFDDRGAVDGIFCEGFDLTGTMRAYSELKRTQAWLQEGLDAANMVAFEWDITSGHVRYSANSRKVLGYVNAASEIGLSSVHPDDREALEAQVRRACEQHGEFQRVHRRLRPDTGALIWTDSRGRVYETEDGDVMRGVIIDVTERVRSEQALREANRRKDEFLAMLAHELRNPLAPISMGSALLAKRPDDAKAVRNTGELIARQVNHMSDLLDDLLDVSRVTRGLIEIERAPVDLGQAVSSALEQVRPLIESRRHLVAIDLPDEATLVQGDRTRLVQVLVNLLANAAKYTEQGGRIRVRLAMAGTRAQLVIEDNGTGIEPELLPHVFELFTQGARTPDRSQGGLGIGLALVKAIVDLHGGEIRVESAGKGLGSRFVITLPTVPRQPQEPLAPASSEAAPSMLRVLVTDDNVDAADTLATLLQVDGHEVRVCYDARQALAAVEAEGEVPDVCILDVGLPDMTGLELAQRLRAREALDGTLLVALTGYGQAHDREASSRSGFDHHLVKPVDIDALTRVLAACADRQHARGKPMHPTH